MGNINSDLAQYQCDSTYRNSKVNLTNKMPKLGYFSISEECASGKFHIYANVYILCDVCAEHDKEREKADWTSSALVSTTFNTASVHKYLYEKRGTLWTILFNELSLYLIRWNVRVKMYCKPQCETLGAIRYDRSTDRPKHHEREERKHTKTVYAGLAYRCLS